MIQLICCPCGNGFAACREPECYEETDWQRDMRKYVKKGCTVKLIENGTLTTGNNWAECTCPNMNPKEKQPKLFESGINQ